MKTQHTFLLIVSAQCLFAPVIVFGQGAITLIGSSVRNGSFESGVASPWGMGPRDSVVQDATFASHGEWYATLSQVASSIFTNLLTTVRSEAWQFIPVNPSDGPIFLLSFDARAGSPGYDQVYGSVEGASRTVVASPLLRADDWVRYEFRFAFSPAEMQSRTTIRLSILFYNTNGIVGTTYTGYLDNVVLQQIPEPVVSALLGLGGGLLFWAVRRRTHWEGAAPSPHSHRRRSR